MLHHLFVDYIDLLTVDSQVYGSYIKAFRAYYRSYIYPQDFYTDPEPESEASDSKNNKDPEEQIEKNYPLADFEAFAYRKPQEDFTYIDLLDSLGSRELDRDYDWSSYISCYDIPPKI
jgi:hypothetical protein